MTSSNLVRFLFLALCALLVLPLSVAGAPDTFLVTTVEDDGPGSLRRAIEEANVAPNREGVPDVIGFAIPGEGPHAILVYSPLPAITDPLTIDGFSQPGASPNRLELGSDAVRMIELHASFEREGRGPGIRVTAGSTTIRGLSIRDFPGDGIRIEDRGGNRIEENEIAGSGGAGVFVSGDDSFENMIVGNSILKSERVGIELEGREERGGETGPNHYRSSPVLERATRITGPSETGRALRVEGVLRSIPDSTFLVELFASRSDPSRIGAALTDRDRQGEKLLLATNVTTGAAGEATFLIVVPDGVESRAILTATATDIIGNTSELSDALLAPAVLKTWSNAAGGGWNTAANWTPAGVPASGDDVSITTAGTYTVTVDTSPTVGVLTVGGASGTQTLSIAANTLTINGASTVGTNGILSQAGGTITGTGSLTVNGAYNWSAGTMTGTGVTTVNGALNLSGIFVKDLPGGRTLNAAATTTWTGTGALRIGSGSVVNNSGTWDCQSDTNMQNPFGGAATFNNSGTFGKTAGTGESTTFIPFHNTGAVTAQTGTVSLQADGTHTGSFNSSGGTVQFNGGIHNLNAGTSFTGTVVLVLGTLNVNSVLTVPSFTQNGGTLQGAATFTVSGLYSWSTGLITGAGTVNANGGMALSSIFVKDLTGGKILNTPAATTTTWTGTGTVRVGTGSVINNAGTWDCQSDTNIQNPFGGTATFNNSGTFRKSAGVGTTTLFIPFHNTGAVTAQTGTISLQADGTHTGSFNSSGGTVQFNGGIHNLNAGTSFTGTVVLVLGTLNVNSALTVPSFTQNGGTLQGAATFTVSGLYSWSTGLITGAGTVNANGGMALSSIFVKDLTGTKILNTPAGTTVTWTGTGTVRVGTGSVINNAGIWDCQSDTNIQNPFGGTAAFNNSGTFRKTVTAGTTTTFIPFHNTGAVTAQTGTISLQADGTHTGSFNSSGGTVQFNGGIHNLNAGTSFTGTVVLVLGTLNVNSALTVPSFTQNGGTLQGAATFTVSGLYSWSAGLITGTGTVNANGGMALSSIFVKDLTGTKILNTPAGTTVTWTGTGTVRVGTGSVINNAGTWDCQSDTNIQNPFGGTATFNNSGTFRKTVTAGTTTSFIPFHNTGAVTAQAGTISLQSDGTHTGSFNSSGGSVQFNGGIHNLNAGTSFTGTVVLVLGTLNVNSALTVPSFTQNGGTLQGAGTFTVSGLYSWSTGLITGAGTVNANGGMTLSSVFVKDVTTNRILNTSAGSTVTWTGTGPVRVGTGSVINNAGTWDCQSDTSIQNPFGGTAAFNNSGTFKKTVGTGSTSVIVPFTNTGSVQALIGTIAYSAGFVQTAGSTTLNGGAISSTTAMDIQGGILQGIGTVTAAVTNGGQVAPGLSPAILSETGNFTQTAAGSLSIEIGGLTPGTQHDRLAVSGTATLAGTLTATLINGFVPASGDSFTVLTYASKTGTFATLSLPALPAGWYWITSYGATSVTLTAILDTDNDSVPNASDCAPFDAGAFAAPTEIAGDAFAADKQTYSWTSAVPTTGSATVHNVMRGVLRQFPVGTGGSETCLASGISGSSAVDAATPAAGSGVYYLVRARNVCGTGTYGFATSGAERITAICP